MVLVWQPGEGKCFSAISLESVKMLVGVPKRDKSSRASRQFPCSPIRLPNWLLVGMKWLLRVKPE